MSTTVPMLFRLRHIVAMLRKGRRVTAKTIAKDLEVSHRTVQRDFANLIHMFGLPISYDFKAGTYRLDATASNDDLELLQ